MNPELRIACRRLSWVTAVVTVALVVAAISASQGNDAANMAHVMGAGPAPDSSKTSMPWMFACLAGLFTVALRLFAAAPKGE